MGDTKLFHKDFIKTFDIRDLHEKTLKIKISENSKYLLAVGQDIEDGRIYVLEDKEK